MIDLRAQLGAALALAMATLVLMAPTGHANGDHTPSKSVEPCPDAHPEWRTAQTIAEVAIEADPSCQPDDPRVVATVTKGTNNVPMSLLAQTGLSRDAVVKGEDTDGDGDPDVIHITMEVIGLNESRDGSPHYEIAPGISPAFWTFAPKTQGMATEGGAAGDLMRMPAPTIRVEQGDELRLTLENTHYLPHTIHLHGVDHPFVDGDGEGNDGVPQTSETPLMPGERRTYNVTPRAAGTMFYHCHVQPDSHVLMGLQGMVVVEENRPNNTVQTLNLGAGQVRHRSRASREQYDGEFDLLYQGVDRELHAIPKAHDDPRAIAQQTNRVYDETQRVPDYFLLNGRSFPYTIRESMLIVEPGQRYRLRMLNGGSRTFSIHTHGHKFQIQAYDGAELPEGAKYRRDVVGITAAQRADLVLSTTDNGVNSYGPGVWLFHDHREAGVTNAGMSPGGTISMITYAQYLKDNGMPRTQGTDLNRLFTTDYHEGAISVWSEIAPDALIDAEAQTESWLSRSTVAGGLIGLIGVLVGALLSILARRVMAR